MYMDTLLAFDRSLFFAINHLPHTPWSDWLFVTISAVGSLGIGWVIIASILVFRYNYRDRRYLVTFFISLMITVLVTTVLKQLIGRPRPEFSLPDAIVPYPCLDLWCRAESLSFPSFHAAASFCAAYILGYGKRRHDLIWYSVAALIAFSRIYLGKHFPLDVVAGMLIGLGIGHISMQFMKVDLISKYSN